MALTQCSECGGKVSDQAPICPHCNHSLNEEYPPQLLNPYHLSKKGARSYENQPLEAKPEYAQEKTNAPSSSEPKRSSKAGKYKCETCGEMASVAKGYCTACGAMGINYTDTETEDITEYSSGNLTGYTGTFRTMISSILIELIYWLGVVGLVIGGLIIMTQKNPLTGAISSSNIVVGFGLILAGNLVWRVVCEGAVLMFSIHKILISMTDSLETIKFVLTKGGGK